MSDATLKDYIESSIHPVQYGLEHYFVLDKDGQYKRIFTLMYEKYASDGYLRQWFPDRPNTALPNLSAP